MGTTMALAPGLSRKLKKVMESRTDSPDLLSSLTTLSTFYTDNTPHGRKTLRSVIEKRYLSINHDFLFASNAVQQALDFIEEEVSALAACCDRIEKTLSICHASTRDEVNATERLKQELDVTNQRQNIVASFLGDYQLSQDEIIALTAEHLSEGFFRALSHVKLIHSNCKILLRTHHQRAGLELMNMMAGYQEAAYERLCRWIQAECLNLNDVDNPEVGHILKTAILCLKERAVLFKYCIEEIANMRHNALFRRFIGALTRGGPGGMPRPIEVHAHDPLRYVGDMLGWLHQALASEKELVFVLLDTNSSVDGESTTREKSAGAEIESEKEKSEITLVLDRIFEGVCRPFKIRVDQVLKSQPNLIILYKLANTLDFYSYTISDLLGRETVLCDTVWALRDGTEKTFFDVLKSRGEKLLRYTPLVSIDLSPLPAIHEEISLLIEIIKSYDSMMIPVSGKKPDFDPLLSALLDPLIQMCTNAAQAFKSKLHSKQNILRPDSSETLKPFSVLPLAAGSSSSSSHRQEETSSIVFLINSLCAIQHPLKPHPVAADYIEKVGTMIDDHMLTLVTTQVDAILANCNLLDKLYLFQTPPAVGPPLSELDETSASTLSQCLDSFFTVVMAGDICPAQFDRLHVPTLCADASVRVVRSLAQFYDHVYRAVVDPANRYPDPEALVKHPPYQLRTILGI